MIQVVSALIIRDRRILLQQRSPHRDFPFMWESPGGKVETTDANPARALVRELHEELGGFGQIVESEHVGLEVTSFTFEDNEHGTHPAARITFYHVIPPAEWEPQLLDATGLGWFTMDEAESLPKVPGNVHLWGFLNNLQPNDWLFDHVWGPL